MGMDGSSLEIHCVFVETNLNTRLAVLLSNDEYVSLFKEKLCMEHSQCFPEAGEITISAVKIKQNGHFYHLPDSMNLSKAFDGNSNKDWFLSVDAVLRLDKGKLMAAAGSNQNPYDLLEKNTEIPNNPTHVEVADEKTKKRKMRSSHAKKISRKVEAEVATQACATEKTSKAAKKMTLAWERINKLVMLGCLAKRNLSNELPCGLFLLLLNNIGFN